MFILALTAEPVFTLGRKTGQKEKKKKPLASGRITP